MADCTAYDSQGRLVYYDGQTGCLTVDYKDPNTGQQPCYGPDDTFACPNGNQVSGQDVLLCFTAGQPLTA